MLFFSNKIVCEFLEEFIATLDEPMVRKLAIRGLRRGIGSMDNIHSLLIMEDDLDKQGDLTSDATKVDAIEVTPLPQSTTVTNEAAPGDPAPSARASVADWCVCGLCRPMPQAVENKCCRQTKCVTTTSRFEKLCLDTDVLELCIRNMGDIRNDREDNSPRSFRKPGYRQFIYARHGHLGKGNRWVCPSCVVIRIRSRFPSLTGVYMGYQDH